MSGLSELGQDYYGVFPLLGKLLNVREASPQQLNDNEAIMNIKMILGLQHNKVYENVGELRYGHLMIMADQDHDGSHIKGLIINYFYWCWPSLLKVPDLLRVFITPIYKASNKKTKKVRLFYSIAEYEAWEKKLGDKATEYQIEYYKGLASIPRKEGKMYFADVDHHIKDFYWDDDAIELAFSKKKIKERKDWLLAFKPSTILDLKEKHIRYRDFIHLDFRQYLVANLQRSIPSMVDGLKPDQRNILFCAFKEPIIQELNVAQFSDYVSLLSPFDHGEASLVGTIVGMAQNYVGSNNINLLQPKGQFGTRQMGGKDHGRGRYLFTQLSPITRCLFHEDELLLKYLKDGGRSIEAAWFIPIIPMVLVNGSKGLGTECSSFIPNYNPQDIICNLKRLLNGETMVAMQPWYKWFNGNIERTALEEYTTTGIYKVIKDENALSITELPVRRWTQDYKEFLEAASQDGKDKKVSYKEFSEVYMKDKTPFIKAYTAHYDDEIVHFKIFMTQDQMNTAEQEGFLKKFKLTSTLSTTNMHLFDANGVIKKYDTPEQILEEFFDLRLGFYKDMKTALLRELKKALSLLENKVNYIDQVLQGKIHVFDRKNDELCKELKRNGFKPFPKETIHAPSISGAVGEDPRTEYEYLLSIGNASISYKKMQELQQEMNAKKEELDLLTKTSPESLWRRDLNALDHQLKKQDKIDDMIIRKQERVNKKMTYETDSDEEEPEIAEEEPEDDNDATEDSDFEDEE
ncbi:DNA topoisomerase 2 isoform X2, partial [Tanacetum coccineum]